MFARKSALVAALVAATATVAFAAPTSPAVIARTQAMQGFGAAMKAITPMAKGEAPFDAAAAAAAFATLAAGAAQVPALFEANEADPESHAKAEIWANMADFTAKAGALATAAATDVSTLEALQAAMGPVGEACKACHMAYKSE